MGQKVNPHGFRVGVIKDWNAKWYADKRDFADNIVEDQKIREFIKERLTNAGISEVKIERAAKRVKVDIHTAKPGVVIGRGGSGIETLKKDMLPIVDGKTLVLNIVEVKEIDKDAQLLAENIAGQLERRISYRRAMKQVIQRARRAGAEGIKTQCSGRLGGAEIARTEFYREGSIPLQTLRADIQYGFAEANTTYGKIGVKVWIYKGEILPEVKTEEEEKNA
ncbi:MAG: 30S ribosomal protein S3 [Clostridium sp.]|nr:30S ribosomal protein S3 [Clostridium sp.]